MLEKQINVDELEELIKHDQSVKEDLEEKLHNLEKLQANLMEKQINVDYEIPDELKPDIDKIEKTFHTEESDPEKLKEACEEFIDKNKSALD
jgi:hypothetical protein